MSSSHLAEYIPVILDKERVVVAEEIRGQPVGLIFARWDYSVWRITQAVHNSEPSSSQWFVLYGLDRVGCLALMDFAGVLMIWNRSDMHLTSGEIQRRSCSSLS